MAGSWDHFRSFLAVLTEGSLSAAARRLRLTQPTLGRHISELEQDLGVALFTRSQAGLTPTEAAIELRPYAEAMAGAADALIRAASGEASEDRGSVRLTASEVVAIEVLPPILTAFREAHPRIAIEVLASNRNEDLLRRTADIAVRMVRPTQAALVARRIGTIEIGLHAHRRYLERAGMPSSLRDLAGHSIIGYDHETMSVQLLQALGLSLEREMFALRTDSDVMQLAAIRAGYGIGVCQVHVARRDPNLVHILPGEFSFDLDCWLAMHEDIASTRRVRLVFDHLTAGLGAYVAGRKG
ncbi:LysR family transcriptional regulator [Kaistia dalseonensis]|uniref:DNA-binding transcriptional LysR family regulator n=1 Tax=Kaistia dalseonensis TaxID=410840 RepID=A0ABU0HAL6_9HYPH|nr:LysR family transcriptional regulator [Kaistia dalseonensis]MCX5496411.1 LysR family transcriptional regulator [Kaistia dalseonensis]MDQ0439032.1 DNA-binding transcriptional LysR family regulator [Kaistia dalseonensis]